MRKGVAAGKSRRTVKLDIIAPRNVLKQTSAEDAHNLRAREHAIREIADAPMAQRKQSGSPART